MGDITRKIQINIPFTMLHETYLSRFIEQGLNPEIGFDAWALDRFYLSDFKCLAKQLLSKDLSVTLHAPFMDLSPGSPEPEVRALTSRRFKQLLELVPLFQPRAVVCHTGWDEKRYWGLRDTWIQHSLEFWSWVEERVRAEGTLLVLENVYEQHPNEFLELLDHLKERRVGFCLDTGHHAVFSRVSLSIWLETLGEYLVQLHLHDNHGLCDDHLAMGKGTIDFPSLFGYLKERNMTQPIITLEPHREEDLWPSLEYLRGIWPWDEEG